MYKRKLQVLASALLLAMSMPSLPVMAITDLQAGADGRVVVDNSDGQVSIKLVSQSQNNPIKGKSFLFYRLLDMEGNEQDGFSYTFTDNAALNELLKKTVYEAMIKSGGKYKDLFASPQDALENMTSAQIAQFLGAMTQEKPFEYAWQDTDDLSDQADPYRFFLYELTESLNHMEASFQISVPQEYDGDFVDITGMPYGYYVIIEEGTTLEQGVVSSVMATSAAPSQTIYLKSAAMGVQKKIVNLEAGAPFLPLEDFGDASAIPSDYEEQDFAISDPREAESAQIGDIVHFQATAVLDDISAYENYPVVLEDAMPTGMEFAGFNWIEIEFPVFDQDGNETGMETVRILPYQLYGPQASRTLQSLVELTFDDPDNSLLVSMNLLASRAIPGQDGEVSYGLLPQIGAGRFVDDALAGVKGTKIRVFYSARLTDKCVLGQNGNINTLSLHYPSDPQDPEKTSQESDKAGVYSFGYQMFKLDEMQHPVWQASFALYREDGLEEDGKNAVGPDDDELVSVLGADGRYVINGSGNAPSLSAPSGTSPGQPVSGESELKTGQDGLLQIDGLSKGTYYLKEVQAPVGYESIKTPIELEVMPCFAVSGMENEPDGGLLEGWMILSSYQDSKDVWHYQAYADGFDSLENLPEGFVLESRPDPEDQQRNITILSYKDIDYHLHYDNEAGFIEGTGFFEVLDWQAEESPQGPELPITGVATGLGIIILGGLGLTGWQISRRKSEKE